MTILGLGRADLAAFNGQTARLGILAGRRITSAAKYIMVFEKALCRDKAVPMVALASGNAVYLVWDVFCPRGRLYGTRRFIAPQTLDAG